MRSLGYPEQDLDLVAGSREYFGKKNDSNVLFEGCIVIVVIYGFWMIFRYVKTTSFRSLGNSDTRTASSRMFQFAD